MYSRATFVFCLLVSFNAILISAEGKLFLYDIQNKMNSHIPFYVEDYSVSNCLNGGKYDEESDVTHDCLCPTGFTGLNCQCTLSVIQILNNQLVEVEMYL